jgi:dTDP-4-amino-4,6-dideoxygalactose transaminase
MRVPLLDLKAQFAPLRDAVLGEVARVCDAQMFVLGPDVERFERDVAAYLGVSHAIGVSSGTDAILAVLMALGVGPGDEVVTPTYSFFATAGCVWRLGARPVLADVDPATFNITADEIARVLTPRTRAILPVHLFGQMVEMAPVQALAARHGVAVIEDACQAIGASEAGVRAGGAGDMACFSFFPSKNLGGFGDGGLVTTNDAGHAARIRLLRGHGAHTKYHHHIVGGNFRLDALQAAVLGVKLPHLEAWTEGRRRNAARYRVLFADAAAAAGVTLGVGTQLPTPPGVVVLPAERPDARHIYNQFVIRTGRRDELKAHLAAREIGTEVYYPVPFHLQECFAALGHRAGEFPAAEACASDSLALPIYAELADDQLHFVVESIIEFARRG